MCSVVTQGDVFIAPQSPVKTSRTGLGPCTALVDKLASNMGPLTTPTKRRDVRSVDPWTPTSNLKMLISAASPDIRNREKELCLDQEGEEALDPTQVQRRPTTAPIDPLECFNEYYYIKYYVLVDGEQPSSPFI